MKPKNFRFLIFAYFKTNIILKPSTYSKADLL